jgi:peptidoglycan/xylan/chitin deacetylase (PgdA/CDA1 family)
MDRHAIAAALDRLGVPQAAMTLRRAAAPWITVLTYHRVASPGDAAMLEEGVVDVTPSQLERQLAFVKRWFRPVGIDDILAHCSEGKPLPPNPLLVTFDDGYRDNHDVALPILLRHGVRATFFVATDYVERRRPFWWDCVAYVLKRSPREHLVLEYPEHVELPLRDQGDRERAIRRALRTIKDVRFLDLGRFLDELQRAADSRLGADEQRRLADETVMTWDQVAALRRAGMDVQSHTRTHRVLQTLDAASLADELRGSRGTLEDVLGQRVRAISYPVGKPLRAASAVREAVRSAGYEVGFSNGTGVSSASSLDPLDVKRISLDVSLSDPFFRAMLALPWLAY